MSVVNAGSSSRTFLLQASALTVAAALPARLSAQADASLDAPIDMKAIEEQAVKIPNRDTLLKFNADGTRKPFAATL